MTDQQNATPQRASLTPDWTVPRLRKIEPFDSVRNRVETMRDLRIVPMKTSLRARGIEDVDVADYDVVDLRSLKFSSAGQVQVPGQGILEMTPWARQQLGGELGVRWDKFFGDMDPKDIQAAVTKHLDTREQGSLKKIIARRHLPDEESGSSVGILRAFVSPSYAEIPDALVMDRMQHVLGNQVEDMGFYETSLTDRGSFMTLVYKEPVSMLADGGRDETGFYGVRIRNSEVGAFSLIADGYLLRLICINGMIAGFTQERWLYRRHRQIDPEMLDNLVDGLFTRLENNKTLVQRNNQILLDTPIENPAAEIRSFLHRHQRPKIEQDAAVSGYLRDLNMEPVEDESTLPPGTAYNVMQGIARLGMAIRNNPERQHEVEVMAGDYMRRVLAQHSALAA